MTSSIDGSTSLYAPPTSRMPRPSPTRRRCSWSTRICMMLSVSTDSADTWVSGTVPARATSCCLTARPPARPSVSSGLRVSPMGSGWRSSTLEPEERRHFSATGPRRCRCSGGQPRKRIGNSCCERGRRRWESSPAMENFAACRHSHRRSRPGGVSGSARPCLRPHHEVAEKGATVVVVGDAVAEGEWACRQSISTSRSTHPPNG